MLLTMLEYVLCYSTAFLLGLGFGVFLTYMVMKQIEQDDIC